MNQADIERPAPAETSAGAAVSDRAAGSQLVLRQEILSGRFVASKSAEVEQAFSDMLCDESVSALRRWFGEDAFQELQADPDGMRGALDRDIAQIDELLSEQVDAILHHPRLQRLEGTWRGIGWLINVTDLSSRLKVKILNAAWGEVCRDLERAIEFDQSQLFRKIYEEEFGSPGGEPYGILILDHEARHRPSQAARTDDVNALAALAGVAAAAFCPVILGAAPALLDVDHFADLSSVIDVAAPLRDTDHARWRGLRNRSDMRFIGVALPRVLARAPWNDDGTRPDSFRYREYTPTTNERVWMSAAFAFGGVVARAFANYSWPADVRGVETDRVGGGLVEGACLEPFRVDSAGVSARVPLEIVWNDRQERALLDAGLMPISSLPFSDELVFGAVRSLLSPQRYSGPTAEAAEANARLSAQLNSILCASRFAHHLKMKGRQMVGSFKTAGEIEQQLQSWLMRYINANTSAAGDSRARFPLVGGRVRIQELAGKPGSFGCVIQLQPHYQLDDVAATFQLVTDLGNR